MGWRVERGPQILPATRGSVWQVVGSFEARPVDRAFFTITSSKFQMYTSLTAPLDANFILRFFRRIIDGKIGLLSEGDLADELLKYPGFENGVPMGHIQYLCNKLEQNNLLTFTGMKGAFGRCFMAPTLPEADIHYGTYNFTTLGFPYIRMFFEKSILPVVVRLTDDSHDIGTCFLAFNNCVITARHCIEDMKIISITTASGDIILPKKIAVYKDKMKDVAVIFTQQASFIQPCLRVAVETIILDDVLIMGYPPLPGFDAVQVSEVTSIGSHTKAARGNIVGQGKSYLDNQDYYVINARVKGGNSGGPVIQKHGVVVGMLVQIPTNPEDNSKLDALGYGIAVPSNDILTLHQAALKLEEGGSNDLAEFLPFKNLEKGFQTAF